MNTINILRLSPQAVDGHVKRIVKGAATASEAETRLRTQLSPEPSNVWVQESSTKYAVLIQIRPGDNNRSIICER